MTREVAEVVSLKDGFVMSCMEGLLSERIVKWRCKRYGLKYFVAQITANNSFSHSEYFNSLSVNVLDINAMGLSPCSYNCAKLAPMAYSQASVVKIVSRSGSKIARQSGDAIASLSVLTAFVCLSFHSKGVSLCENSWRGRALCEK